MAWGQASSAARPIRAVRVIADLSRVDFLDSTGLGVLVGGLKRLREHDGSLTLVTSAARILRLLEMTGLTRVFPAQPSVPAAITADPHWRQAAESEAGTAEEWCRRHGLSRGRPPRAQAENDSVRSADQWYRGQLAWDARSSGSPSRAGDAHDNLAARTPVGHGAVRVGGRFQVIRRGVEHGGSNDPRW